MFEIGSLASIKVSGETGEIVGHAKYADGTNRFLLRYVTSEGRATEEWWDVAALGVPDAYLQPGEQRRFSANDVHAMIAGALYDFAASLTTREEPLTLGKNHDAAVAAQAVNEFAILRQLNQDEANVNHWSEALQRKDAQS